jgi:hypothetical protein
MDDTHSTRYSTYDALDLSALGWKAKSHTARRASLKVKFRMKVSEPCSHPHPNFGKPRRYYKEASGFIP